MRRLLIAMLVVVMAMGMCEIAVATEGHPGVDSEMYMKSPNGVQKMYKPDLYRNIPAGFKQVNIKFDTPFNKAHKNLL